MQVIVLADEAGKAELMMKKINSNVQVIFIQEFAEVADYSSADVFFYYKRRDWYSR